MRRVKNTRGTTQFALTRHSRTHTKPCTDNAVHACDLNLRRARAADSGAIRKSLFCYRLSAKGRLSASRRYRLFPLRLRLYIQDFTTHIPFCQAQKYAIFIFIHLKAPRRAELSPSKSPTAPPPPFSKRGCRIQTRLPLPAASSELNFRVKRKTALTIFKGARHSAKIVGGFSLFIFR